MLRSWLEERLWGSSLRATPQSIHFILSEENQLTRQSIHLDLRQTKSSHPHALPDGPHQRPIWNRPSGPLRADPVRGIPSVWLQSWSLLVSGPPHILCRMSPLQHMARGSKEQGEGGVRGPENPGFYSLVLQRL